MPTVRGGVNVKRVVTINMSAVHTAPGISAFLCHLFGILPVSVSHRQVGCFSVRGLC